MASWERSGSDRFPAPTANASRDIIQSAKEALVKINAKGILESKVRERFGNKGRIKEVDASWQTISFSNREDDTSTAIGWVFELAPSDDPFNQFGKHDEYEKEGIFVGFVGNDDRNVDGQPVAPLHIFGVTSVWVPNKAGQERQPKHTAEYNVTSIPELPSYKGRVTDSAVRRFVDGIYRRLVHQGSVEAYTGRTIIPENKKHITGPNTEYSGLPNALAQADTIANLKSQDTLKGLERVLREGLDYEVQRIFNSPTPFAQPNNAARPLHPGVRPPFLRSDGTRDQIGADHRPESVQGQSTSIRPGSYGNGERRFGGGSEHPPSVQNLPNKTNLPGGGGQFGK